MFTPPGVQFVKYESTIHVYTVFLCRVDSLNAARLQDREKIERHIQQLSDYEAEINMLRRRIENLEADRERDKKEIARLTEALNRARMVSTHLSRLGSI